ncbi:retrotransposon protein, putative, ty1-copia subclass [Tanacetum coccineum]
MGKTIGELHALLIEYEKGYLKRLLHLKSWRFNVVESRNAIRNHKMLKGKALSGERKLKQGAVNLYVGNGVRAQVEAIGSFNLVLPNGLVWECETLVKRDTPEKLQQRSVKCIFVGYQKETMVYYFYFPPKNKIVVARYVEFLEKNLISQEASGRAVELEEIQDKDTPPSENTSDIPTEVEVEEHSLGDLNEPAKYKATLLDLKSDKWLDAMNAEMQSRKDNQFWCLVDLHPNGWIIPKHGNIPMQERLDLNKTQGASTPEEVKHMNNFPYASAVGSIINTKDMFLVYGGNIEAELRVTCYCDAGFETDRDDNIQSQTRYDFILNGGVVDWKSSKKSTTAMSAIEAEYITDSEAVWIWKFISGLFHTDDNLADPFMKALSKVKLTQHARSIGFRLASSFM